MSTRFRQAFWGFVSDVGGSTLLVVFTFAATPVILKLTSQSLYGFWLAVLSVLGYFGLADLGFGLALTRAVAERPDDTGAASKGLISTAFWIFCLGGLFVCLAGLAIAGFIPRWFHVPAQDTELVLSAYRIAIVSGGISLTLSVFPAILVGMHRMALVNNLRNSAAIAAIGVSIAFLYLHLSVIALALGYMLNVALVGAVSAYSVFRSLPELSLGPSLFNRSDCRKLWEFGGYFQGGKVASIIAGNTDPVVIAMFLGAAAVTPYTLTSKLAIFISISLASKLPIALFPALSEMFARQDTEKIQRTLLLLTYYSTRLAVVGAAFLVVANREFVSLWVGSASFGGTALNLVFVYWVLQDTIIRGSGVVIQASGDLRKWAAASLYEAAANVISSILLVRYIGLVGVALGTSIARTPSGLYILHYTCKKIGLPWKRLLSEGVVRPFMKSLPAAAAAVALWFLTPSGWGWGRLAGFGLLLAMGNVITFEGVRKLLNPRELFRFSSLVSM